MGVLIIAAINFIGIGALALAVNFSNPDSYFIRWIAGILPWALNIGAIIVAGVKKKPKMVLGMLAFWGIGFALVVVLLVITTVLCIFTTW